MFKSKQQGELANNLDKVQIINVNDRTIDFYYCEHPYDYSDPDTVKIGHVQLVGEELKITTLFCGDPVTKTLLLKDGGVWDIRVKPSDFIEVTMSFEFKMNQRGEIGAVTIVEWWTSVAAGWLKSVLAVFDETYFLENPCYFSMGIDERNALQEKIYNDSNAGSEEARRDKLLERLRDGDLNFTSLKNEPQYVDDYDVVKLIVTNWGCELEYVSEKLRDNIDICLAAINNDYRAYTYCSERLKNDVQVVEAVILKTPWAIRIMPVHLWCNDEKLVKVCFDPESTTMINFLVKHCEPSFLKKIVEPVSGVDKDLAV